MEMNTSLQPFLSFPFSICLLLGLPKAFPSPRTALPYPRRPSVFLSSSGLSSLRSLKAPSSHPRPSSFSSSCSSLSFFSSSPLLLGLVAWSLLVLTSALPLSATTLLGLSSTPPSSPPPRPSSPSSHQASHAHADLLAQQSLSRESPPSTVSLESQGTRLGSAPLGPPAALLQTFLPHQNSRAYSLKPSPWWVGEGRRWWFACPSQVSECREFPCRLQSDGEGEEGGARNAERGRERGLEASDSPRTNSCTRRQGSEGAEDKTHLDTAEKRGRWLTEELGGDDGKGGEGRGSGDVRRKQREEEEEGRACGRGTSGRGGGGGGSLLSWLPHLPRKTAEVLVKNERERCSSLLVKQEEAEKRADGGEEERAKTGRGFASFFFSTCDESGESSGEVFWDRARYKELQQAAYLNEEFPPVLEVFLSVLLLFLLPFIFNRTVCFSYALLHGAEPVHPAEERKGKDKEGSATEREGNREKSFQAEEVMSRLVLSSSSLILPLPSFLRPLASGLFELSFELVFLVIPLLLAYCLPEMLLPVTLGAASLALFFVFFSPAPTRSSPFSSSSTASSWNDGCVAVLTEFRGMLTIATCIAILGVDFFVFPRSLAKTCLYGLSLMDLGVGCFVFGSGVVSPEARRFQRSLSSPWGESSRKLEEREKETKKKSPRRREDSLLIDRRRGLLQGRSEEEDEGQEVQASDAAAKSRSREEGERGQKLLKGGAEERTSEGLCDEEDSALPVEQKPRVLDLVYLWGFFLWFICLCKKRKEDQEKKTLFYERVSKKKSVVSTRRGRNALWRAVGRSGVLGVLGFFRFLLLLLCDYHTPETEYGSHWNFYLTLMVVFLAAEGFHSATHRALLVPSSYILWGLAVAVGYQVLIWLGRLDDGWIFTATRDNFFSANREGILGCFGFFSLYLMGVGVGAFLASSCSSLHSTSKTRSSPLDENQRKRRKDEEDKEKLGDSPRLLRNGEEEQRKKGHSSPPAFSSGFLQTSQGTFAVLFGGSVLFFLVYLLLSLGCGVYPTRRLNNLPWIILVASLNFFAISGLILGEICLGHSRRVYISRMLEGISFNQIVIFLLANVLSGLVGICLKTLLLPPIAALCILVTYSLLWSSVGFLLGRARTIIKLSF